MAHHGTTARLPQPKPLTITDSPDISISGGMGFYSIAAETPEGIAFMDLVEGSEDGQAYSDDTRLTQEIADAAADKGLTVEVNGTRYFGGAA